MRVMGYSPKKETYSFRQGFKTTTPTSRPSLERWMKRYSVSKLYSPIENEKGNMNTLHKKYVILEAQRNFYSDKTTN